MAVSTHFEKDYASEIRKITYKEVSIFWNIDPTFARKRLNIIRHLLNKSSMQWVSKEQYCKVEDITVEEFDTRINQFYNRSAKKSA